MELHVVITQINHEKTGKTSYELVGIGIIFAEIYKCGIKDLQIVKLKTNVSSQSQNFSSLFIQQYQYC